MHRRVRARCPQGFGQATSAAPSSITRGGDRPEKRPRSTQVWYVAALLTQRIAVQGSKAGSATLAGQEPLIIPVPAFARPAHSSSDRQHLAEQGVLRPPG